MFAMEEKKEERMLVAVTVNLMHKMEEFKGFKEEQGIRGDYEAKIAYLVEKFHMSDQTAENLLSGKVVSKNNYLAIFPSFDKDNIDKKSTALERFAETIVDEIEKENEDYITEVSNIITNKLEKLDLKNMAKAVLSDDKRVESLKNSIISSLKSVEFPNKKTKINDYALIVWIDHFYKSISEQDNLFEIISKLDTLSKAIEYLPLVEKLLESEENIEILSRLDSRLDSLMLVERLEELGLLDCIEKATNGLAGMNEFNIKFGKTYDKFVLLDWLFNNAKKALNGEDIPKFIHSQTKTEHDIKRETKN
jgi:hypothetical protein